MSDILLAQVRGDVLEELAFCIGVQGSHFRMGHGQADGGVGADFGIVGQKFNPVGFGNPVFDHFQIGFARRCCLGLVRYDRFLNHLDAPFHSHLL